MSAKRALLQAIVLIVMVLSLVPASVLAKLPSGSATQVTESDIALALQHGEILASPANPPVLLIVNSSASNKFGLYLGEILRAEGLDAFDQVELNSLTAAQLAQYDLAVLAQTPLTSAQATMLANYVSGGGALLAMRPDSQIAGLFGLSQNNGTLNNGYLQIKNGAAYNGAAPGYGLTSATLQIHGNADLYTTSPNAVVIAQLYSDSATSTPYPAVAAANYGSGQASAFTYDLASNVVYTRQGNPANADLDVDGDFYVRTIDLFQTVGGGAPWVDRDRIPIPQADEQQRLFARLVEQMVGRNRPLPRLWYFPETAKTMLILTGDGHINPDSLFQNEIASLNAHQGKITLYLTPWEVPTDSEVQTWRSQGHTFGIHPTKRDFSTLAAAYDEAENWYSSTFSSLKSPTVRNHRLAWEGWTSAADIAVAHNIALDLNFYHWGQWLQKPDGTWPHGYITGSGQPMKFMRADGTLISLYQQLTELADEQLVNGAASAWEGLTASQALAVSQDLINASLAGDYAALVTQYHVDYYSNDPQLWAEGTTDYARSQGIPVWNADQWLSFTQTRHDANYHDIAWNASTGVLSFNITMTATAGMTLTTILPLDYGGQPLQSVTVDGNPYAFSVQTIKSTNVAFVSIPAGDHSVNATYSGATPTDTPTPTPTGSPTPTPTATSTPTTGFVDTTVADFSAGSPDANLYIAQTADGELLLAPTVGAEFSGSTLPADWFSTPWATGGSATVGGGMLTVDGALVGTNAWYGPGRFLEFVATFMANTSQHVGLGTDLNAPPWAIFSTGYPGGTTLKARTYSNSASSETDLGGYLGAPHRYRIEWTASGVVYSIDGVQVALHSVAIADNMRPVASDQPAGAALSMDWLRMSPYAASGAFVSHIFDAGAAHWLNLTWNGSQPTGTSVSFETRVGNTDNPDDGTWSAWAPVSGTAIASPDGRYLQYRVTLASADTWSSPTVEQVAISYQALPTPTPTDTPTPTPTLTPTWYSLTVNIVGNGSVTRNPDQAAYHEGDVVTLTAASGAGWTFADWGGDLDGSANPTTITMNGNKSVAAMFTQIEYTMTVNVVGDGSVARNPDQTTYHYGDEVTLTAAINPGFTFASWSGDLTDNTNPQLITIDGNKTVTATFTLNRYTLSVAKAGNGSGVVTSSPAGITCGAICSTIYDYNTVVTLTAAADAGSVFTGWDGDLSGAANPQVIILNANKVVTATFLPINIFADGFESGNLSAWSSAATNGGRLSVTAGSAMVGAFGLQASISDATAMYVTDDTPSAEPRYRARFYFDPNSILMGNGNAHYIFYGYSGASTVVLRIELRSLLSKYQLRAGLVDDSTTWRTSTWFNISDAPHFVEIDWSAATAAGANNGYLTLWVDGVQRANLTRVNNDTRRIDRVRLGPVAGTDRGTRGTYYFDAFESRRATYIGP